MSKIITLQVRNFPAEYHRLLMYTKVETGCSMADIIVALLRKNSETLGEIVNEYKQQRALAPAMSQATVEEQSQ